MFKRCVLLFTGLLALGACTTSPTGRNQLVLMPDSQMDQMGLQAFTSIKGDTGIERPQGQPVRAVRGERHHARGRRQLGSRGVRG